MLRLVSVFLKIHRLKWKWICRHDLVFLSDGWEVLCDTSGWNFLSFSHFWPITHALANARIYSFFRKTRWYLVWEEQNSNKEGLQPLSLTVYFLESGHWIWEKAMATHSSTLAWEILWTEEPGGLQSTGSLRVRQDWATSLSLFTSMHWRRKWQPPPVFLPGNSQGQGSLVGCRLWGRTESDTTNAT